jgi:chromosome segregation ATPase
LRYKVTKWQENRQKLNTLLASLDKDRKDMLGKLDAFSKSGKPEAEIAPEVKILSTELQEINRQSATYKAKQRDYDLAILKSESKLRSIERQLAASEAGVSESDITELTRTMLALDDNLNSADAVSSVVSELDDSVAKQLAEFRASKDAEIARIKDQLNKQAEMAASKATVIVTVTPADAKVLVTGNGVTVTGSGGSRVVTIDNPIGEYRLIV